MDGGFNMDGEDAGDGVWFNMDGEDAGDGGFNMDGEDAGDFVEEVQLEYGDLTGKVIGAAFEVINELGAGFLESVYEKALFLVLLDKGIAVRRQVPIPVTFRNQLIGEFFADLLVEGRLVVELKAAKALAPEHHAQIINYLKASSIPVGLLINFGNPRLEYRRFTRKLNPSP